MSFFKVGEVLVRRYEPFDYIIIINIKPIPRDCPTVYFKFLDHGELSLLTEKHVLRKYDKI